MMDLAAAARAYGERGWPIFPLRPRDKIPITPRGFHDASADLELIARWWEETPDANIGCVPGQTGHIVFDLDGADGEAAAQALGLTIQTLHVVTARGRHLYYKHPGGTIGNRILAPHLDVRADAGYVILPPSVHSTGVVYQWHGKLDDARSVPLEIVRGLQNGSAARVAAPIATGSPIPKGQRNATLTSLAGTMRRRGMEAPEMIAALLVVNTTRCDPPLSDADVERIAHSVARYAPAASPSPNPSPVPPSVQDDDVAPPEADAPAPTHTAVTVSLATVKPEPVRWLWPARIPRGKLTMLDGDPGLGKSTLALDLTARLTTGRAFPDGSRAETGGVVVLTAEDGLADTVRPRLDAMGGDAARVVALTGVRDAEGVLLPLTLPDHLDALRSAIAEVQAALAIVDPFTAFLASYVNSRIDHDIRRTLAPLAALAQETGVALLLIRHLNKTPGGNPLYRGGGSIGLIAAARSGLLVAEDPEDATQRVFAVVKANLAPRATSLVYRLESAPNGVARVVWGGESVHTAATLLAVPENAEDRNTLRDAKTWLRDFLTSGPKPPTEIGPAGRAAGYAWRTLERAKAQLGVQSVKRGFGDQGAWVWVLPKDRLNEGKAALGDSTPPGSLESSGTDQRPPKAAKTAESEGIGPQAAFGEEDPDADARDAMREGA
jgi:bifunctional DNA primase/polymerase-like protein/AAA domain-containing protein/primase-like protein